MATTSLEPDFEILTNDELPTDVAASPALRAPRTGALAVGLATVVVCVSYAAWRLDQGWIPHDEGQLGLTAQRILQGELPHRDFVDPYTGGLGFYNAAAFRVFGVNSIVMRASLLPLFALFCGSLYWIAARVAGPATAVLVTLLSAALTLPIYPAGMPSWYNLFLAVCGVAALLRYRETDRRRWLIVAGLCGGLSIAVKIVGVYFVAAALAFLLYDSCRTARRTCHGHRNRLRLVSVWLSSVLGLCGLAGLLFLRAESLPLDVVHFAVPVLCLAVAMIAVEWERGGVDWNARGRRVGETWGWFAAGVAIPLAVLLTPFLLSGAVGDLLHGVFVLPARRLSGAAKPFAGSAAVLFAAAPLACVALVGWSRGEWQRRLAFVLGGVLAAQFAVSMLRPEQVVLYVALRHSLPLLVVAATATLLLAPRLRNNDAASPVRRRDELFLLSATTVFVSLVQYPYSGDFYFFFAAPLGVLLALYTMTIEPQPPVRFGHLVLVLVLVFVVTRLHFPNPAIAGGVAVRSELTRRLEQSRSPLIVRADQARLYDDVIRTVRAHSREGAYIYAGPDCPEIYFLAERRNPTRFCYSLFSDRTEDPGRDLLATIEQHDVRVVVVRLRSEFSQHLPTRLSELLERRFTHRRRFEAGEGRLQQTFDVLWRTPADEPATPTTD